MKVDFLKDKKNENEENLSADSANLLELDFKIKKIDKMNVSEDIKKHLKKGALNDYDNKYKIIEAQYSSFYYKQKEMLELFNLTLLVSQLTTEELKSREIVKFYSYVEKINRFFLYNYEYLDKKFSSLKTYKRCNDTFDTLDNIRYDIMLVPTKEKITHELILSFHQLIIKTNAIFHTIIKDKEAFEYMYGLDFDLFKDDLKNEKIKKLSD